MEIYVGVCARAQAQVGHEQPARGSGQRVLDRERRLDVLVGAMYEQGRRDYGEAHRHGRGRQLGDTHTWCRRSLSVVPFPRQGVGLPGVTLS